ncbi:MAG: ribosome-binding factor A [Chitinophagales bacterium]|nr:ribosome-binding factor A [Chitinophagales bacterium]
MKALLFIFFTFVVNRLVMEEGKRQKQIAAVLLDELNIIFRKLGLNMMDGGMVSISSVKVTPDLLEARIYLSLFRVADTNAAMKKIENLAWEIKRDLVNKIKHQVRRIPVLHFYLDDTLDYVFKMEEVFKKIEEEKNE